MRYERNTARIAGDLLPGVHHIMSTDPYEKHYFQLVGNRVCGLVHDTRDPETWGLRMSDGSIAWILCDEEGNGPGFLDIQKPKKGTK